MNHFKESKMKSGLTTRWVQMSKQEQIIERKKMEIQSKLEAQRQAAAMAAQAKLENINKAENKSSSNIFSNDGSFMNQFKSLLEKQKKENDDAPKREREQDAVNFTEIQHFQLQGDKDIDDRKHDDYSNNRDSRRDDRKTDRRRDDRGNRRRRWSDRDKTQNHSPSPEGESHNAPKIPSLMHIAVNRPEDQSNDNEQWDPSKLSYDHSSKQDDQKPMGHNMGQGPNMPPGPPPHMPPNMMIPGSMHPMNHGGPPLPSGPPPPISGGHMPPYMGYPPFMGPNGPMGPMPPFFRPPFPGGPMMGPNSMMGSNGPNQMMGPNGPNRMMGPNGPNQMMGPNGPPNSMMGPNGPPNNMMPPNGPPNSMMSSNIPPNSMMGSNGPANNMMPPNGPPNNMMPPNGPPNMMPPNIPPNMMPPNVPPNSMMGSNGPPNNMMPPNGPPNSMMPPNGPSNSMMRMNAPNPQMGTNNPNSMMGPNGPPNHIMMGQGGQSNPMMGLNSSKSMMDSNNLQKPLMGSNGTPNNMGQNIPMPGQNIPMPGQNIPMPGQNIPMPGQNIPMPGQNIPMPGQNIPMPGQNIPMPGQNTMNMPPFMGSFGQNAPPNFGKGPMPFMPPNSMMGHQDVKMNPGFPGLPPLPPPDMDAGKSNQQVLSAGVLPPSVRAAAGAVARNGDHWESVLKTSQDPTLWFLHAPTSPEYKAFRELVAQLRSEGPKPEVKPEDKYEPEFSLEDDDSNDQYPVKEEGGSHMPHYQAQEAGGGDGGSREERRRRRKSRWGDGPQEPSAPPGVSGMAGMAGMPALPPGPPPPMHDFQANMPNNQLSRLDEDGLKLSTLGRSNPALLQYAMTNYGTVNLSEEDWKKCEDNFKLNLLYQDMLRKRQEVERLAAAGRNKYEYDSDEDTAEGTWEHKLRAREMNATERWADELTKQASGKHHIGDFLPPEELKKFMEKYSALKGGKEPDLSDYKEFKLREDNVGFKMLQKLGWNEGQGLGAEGSGILDPINKAQQPVANLGLGAGGADGVCEDDDEFDAYRKRMMLAYRFRPNPLNNPRRPYY